MLEIVMGDTGGHNPCRKTDGWREISPGIRTKGNDLEEASREVNK